MSSSDRDPSHEGDIHRFPPDIDMSVPSIARTYDAILGGKDNFEPDRAAARVFADSIPKVRECAWENREALIRGVQYLSRVAGVDQFLDIGSGLPTERNTHEAAQEINPEARVVYVDNDPIVLAHGRALLATNNTTSVVTADLRDPHAILTAPEAKRMLDFDRPIALMIVGILMHISDTEEPNRLIGELVDALPSGSYLFITSWPDTGDPAQKSLERAAVQTLGNGWARPVDDLLAHFVGLDLVPPGLQYIAQWFPETPEVPVPDFEDMEPFQRTQMAGIAYKP
ncbi:SAM-dependent methyltransferase [Salinactinospora qingdaonensis]|uniref:SAM-dependent methyltransferase n=1 Tax=Salinactinospora qingdaonensis TaxID=702744 RepID=A0ABP7FY54_9ACTN